MKEVKEIIIACSGAKHIAKRMAKVIKSEYSELEIKKFPDNEIDLRFLKNLKNKEVILVQSFYGEIGRAHV